MLGFQNTKTYTQNWGEVFAVSKIKNTVPWSYVISDLNGEKFAGSFYENELQKTCQKQFRLKKYLKEKVIDYMSNGTLKMNQYLHKPFKSFGGNINVKIDLLNYATNVDLKNVTHVDTSNFTLKTNLASLKTEVDQLGIDKLAPVPVDWSKLSDVVKNDVKKTVYDNWLQK